MPNQPTKVPPSKRDNGQAPSHIPVWKKVYLGLIELSEFGDQSPHKAFFDIVQKDAADDASYDIHSINEYEFTDNVGTVKLTVEQTGVNFNK